MKKIKIISTVLIALNIFAGCQKKILIPTADPIATAESIPGTDQKISIKKFLKPENFVEGNTSQYFPLAAGDTFLYETLSVDGIDSIFENITIAVTTDIKVITGINCMVIHDEVKEAGAVTEDTYDWYAQDIYGNIWYFGEDTKKLQDDGSWSSEGSFENGVDGAVAGIIMPGNPANYIGQTYKQEYYVGHAQDKATIISTDETVTIGLGTYTNCVQTLETSPLAPGVEEYKWYAPGVGQIKSTITVGGNEYEELTAKK